MLSAEGAVILGLGSNMGDASTQFSAVRAALEPYMDITLCSSLYRTKPYGYADQDDFTNAVLAGKPTVDLGAFHTATREIEQRLGKAFVRVNGPRTIDLDILFWGSARIDDPALIVPHPRAHERDFVLLPLLEIAPDFVHPILGKTASELLAAIPAENRFFTGVRADWKT